MDEIRDTQRTESVSRFIEQHPVRMNAFGENRAADRAYRRAERIAAGIHLLTNHISEDEPVRMHARSAASKLLSESLMLKDEMRSPNSSHVSTLLSTLRYLISLLRIMTISGYVSQANAATVVEALDELGSYVVAAQRSILSENVSLSHDDLMDVRVSTFKPVASRPIKDMSYTIGTMNERTQKDTQDSSEKRVDSLAELSSRVQSILEILKVGGSLGIRDISANLPEYSEKMIQRELLDLVSKGKVKKTGLKRWSRYSLAA